MRASCGPAASLVPVSSLSCVGFHSFHHIPFICNNLHQSLPFETAPALPQTCPRWFGTGPQWRSARWMSPVTR
eukprot:7633385-Heterocapsa_arctica.AAC.1